MNPSFFAYDRREKKATPFKGWLLLLGAVFLLCYLLDTLNFTTVEASVQDDSYICANLSEFNTKGIEAEVRSYCDKYGK